MNGMTSWFARNSVAANLLMVFIVCTGVIGALSVRAETNPEFSFDVIQIRVPYLGAAPEEVEEAVCIRIEEAIQGVDGIKKITSTAAEGMASVMVEVETGANTRTVLDEIKSNVDASSTKMPSPRTTTAFGSPRSNAGASGRFSRLQSTRESLAFRRGVLDICSSLRNTVRLSTGVIR